MHYILNPETQSLVHFALQPAVSEMQGCQKKLENALNDPKMKLTLNSQKYSIYTE